jgi:AbrB family looped-hinge helix DNA binding protein
MRRVIRHLRNGQITIPKELRDAIGLSGQDLLSIDLKDGKLEIEPVRITTKGKGSPWARELYEMFEPVRESLSKYSEDEINEAIDEAQKAVRSRKS